jgi:hypothetical protein
VFGNERGKVPIDEATVQEELKWRMFVRRRAARKAGSGATEVTESPPPDPTTPSPPGSPQNNSIDPVLHIPDPSAPPPPGSPQDDSIDPRLRTPNLTLDRSMSDLFPQSVPQTPNAPLSSLHPRQDSPLSNISDGEPAAQNTGSQTLKRKRSKANTERPRARPKRKATRA